MKKTIKSAKLVNNIPHCQCGSKLARVHDYFAARVNDCSLTGFIRYCDNKKCDILSIYYVDITLDENRRYICNEEDVEIISET